MKITLFIISICFTILLSCGTNSKDNSYELWETQLIKMKSAKAEMVDSLTDYSQYLYLYSNGNAKLIDSLSDGTVRQSETKWKIQDKNGKEVFLFGYGNESQGVLGVAYQIIIKNQFDFKMKFDSLDIKHKWNLKRKN